MQISISTRHGQLSDATRERIKAKLEKLPRFFERLQTIQLTVNLEREATPAVTLNVAAEHKHDFTASEQADSLMTAVDGVMHKMEQQLRKYKEKVVERSRDSGKRKQEPTPGAEGFPEPETE